MSRTHTHTQICHHCDLEGPFTLGGGEFAPTFSDTWLWSMTLPQHHIAIVVSHGALAQMKVQCLCCNPFKRLACIVFVWNFFCTIYKFSFVHSTLLDPTWVGGLQKQKTRNPFNKIAQPTTTVLMRSVSCSAC